MANINTDTNFTITYDNNTISGFYKDILINLENILKNHGYSLKYYFTTYYDEKGVVKRSSDKTLCSKNFLTLTDNAYGESLISFPAASSTITSFVNDFSIEITKGV